MNGLFYIEKNKLFDHWCRGLGSMLYPLLLELNGTDKRWASMVTKNDTLNLADYLGMIEAIRLNFPNTAAKLNLIEHVFDYKVEALTNDIGWERMFEMLDEGGRDCHVDTASSTPFFALRESGDGFQLETTEGNSKDGFGVQSTAVTCIEGFTSRVLEMLAAFGRSGGPILRASDRVAWLHLRYLVDRRYAIPIPRSSKRLTGDNFRICLMGDDYEHLAASDLLIKSNPMLSLHFGVIDPLESSGIPDDTLRLHRLINALRISAVENRGHLELRQSILFSISKSNEMVYLPILLQNAFNAGAQACLLEIRSNSKEHLESEDLEFNEVCEAIRAARAGLDSDTISILAIFDISTVELNGDHLVEYCKKRCIQAAQRNAFDGVVWKISYAERLTHKLLWQCANEAHSRGLCCGAVVRGSDQILADTIFRIARCGFDEVYVQRASHTQNDNYMYSLRRHRTLDKVIRTALEKVSVESLHRDHLFRVTRKLAILKMGMYREKPSVAEILRTPISHANKLIDDEIYLLDHAGGTTKRDLDNDKFLRGIEDLSPQPPTKNGDLDKAKFMEKIERLSSQPPFSEPLPPPIHR